MGDVSIVYVVRCNFTRPDLEADWNAWYNGPKTADMLSKPLFLSGQRFRAVGLDRTVKYLALWVLASAEALTTPEYKARWGFFDWTPHVTDWSRNLYRAPEGDLSPLLRVPAGGGLYLAALDGPPGSEPEAGRRALQAERPDILWMSATGLDRSCAAIGLTSVSDVTLPPPRLPPGLASGIRETLFMPISEYRTAR
jgi:hypothetical protein